MFDKHGPEVPLIVSGMSDAELEEFRVYCSEYLGYDLEDMSYNTLWRCASGWYDEMFRLANSDEPDI